VDYKGIWNFGNTDKMECWINHWIQMVKRTCIYWWL